MEFKNFKKDVEAAFNNMIAENLFVANVDKDLLWMGYLLSFEDETVRQDHNCNACKSFIRHYGKVVAIDPQTYKIKTFWDDVHTPGYEKTAQALAKLVKEAGIGDVFIQDVNEFHGCDHNVQLLPDGTTRTWTHLYVTIPNNFKFNRRVHGFDSAAGYRGDVRARAGVFERSISELKLEAVETVIELIEGNNLYRGSGKTRDAVENIIWTDPSRLRPGDYVVRVHNFYKRESIDFGFEMEIEINGELHKFQYGKVVLSKEYIEVARIHVDGQRNISMTPTIKEGSTSFKSTNEWGIDTMKFQKVSCIMFSPNHWEGNAIGNKHLFFMIDGCKNPDPVRGFFNEYLRADLEKEHRRVFEALGSRAKAEYSDDQLSGLGFSSTSHNDVVVKVDNKSFKIIF